MTEQRKALLRKTAQSASVAVALVCTMGFVLLVFVCADLSRELSHYRTMNEWHDRERHAITVTLPEGFVAPPEVEWKVETTYAPAPTHELEEGIFLDDPTWQFTMVNKK